MVSIYMERIGHLSHRNQSKTQGEGFTEKEIKGVIAGLE